LHQQISPETCITHPLTLNNQRGQQAAGTTASHYEVQERRRLPQQRCPPQHTQKCLLMARQDTTAYTPCTSWHIGIPDNTEQAGWHDRLRQLQHAEWGRWTCCRSSKQQTPKTTEYKLPGSMIQTSLCYVVVDPCCLQSCKTTAPGVRV
jgi:hypothetical protein